jgi:hypothetical protein
LYKDLFLPESDYNHFFDYTQEIGIFKAIVFISSQSGRILASCGFGSISYSFVRLRWDEPSMNSGMDLLAHSKSGNNSTYMKVSNYSMAPLEFSVECYPGLLIVN